MFRIVPQLTVRDVSRSVEFYTGLLGFTVTEADPPDAPEFAALDREEASLFLVSDASREALSQPVPGGTPRGVGVRLYLEVDDAVSEHGRLAAAGAQIHRALEQDPGQNYAEFSILDPDGYEIGIFS